MATIEEEIKQKKFTSETQKLVINILFTSSWLSLSSNQMLKLHQLSQEQFNVMRILRGQHPNACSIQTIVDRMIDRSSNASRIVEKLRLKDFATRKECPTDRRLVDVLITQKGLDLLSILDKKIEEWENNFSNINQEEAKELNRILDKLRG
jgi:DNA-binding MarR family transcriptional regulator